MSWPAAEIVVLLAHLGHWWTYVLYAVPVLTYVFNVVWCLHRGEWILIRGAPRANCWVLSGYMVLGLSLDSVAGLAAGIIHIFNHAAMKAALFMAIGCAFSRAGVVSIEDLAGLGRRMPVTMAAVVIGALSLIGVPLTVGFVTKWYLIQAALEIGAWPAAAVVLLSGLIAVAYTWRKSTL